MKATSFSGRLAVAALGSLLSVFAIAAQDTTTETRLRNATFAGIETSAGVDVTLIPDTTTFVKITGSERDRQYTRTHIDGHTLEIGIKLPQGVRRLSSYDATVEVHYRTINNIEASSASKVKNTGNTLRTTHLELEASSAATIDLTVESQSIEAEATSAGEITLKANNATDINAEASSGANIDITGKTATVDLEASSGAKINVRKLVYQSVNAEASSGADIYLAPGNTGIKTSSGGNVHSK